MGCCRDYKVVFQDDFDAFDTNIWAPPPTHGTEFPVGSIKVENSILTVRADQNSPVRDYVEVWSLGKRAGSYPFYPDAKRWQEGYFEFHASAAAIPSSGNAWVKLALWFFSYEWKNDYVDGACPILAAEWDMVENGISTLPADERHTSVLHRNTNAPCSTADTTHNGTLTPGSGLLGWHTWGGLWRNGELTTYIDGVFASTHTAYDSTAQPLSMVISAAPLGLAPVGHESDPVPDFIETYIDWVRVWQ
jgi:hypothetical protein